MEARWRMQGGQDPLPALARARAAFEKAVEVRPKDAAAWAAWADRSRFAADWRRAHGQDARAETAEGLAHAEQALSLVPSLPEALAARGPARLRAERRGPRRRAAAAEGARGPSPRARAERAPAARLGSEIKRADALAG